MVRLDELLSACIDLAQRGGSVIEQISKSGVSLATVDKAEDKADDKPVVSTEEFPDAFVWLFYFFSGLLLSAPAERPRLLRLNEEDELELLHPLAPLIRAPHAHPHALPSGTTPSP